MAWRVSIKPSALADLRWFGRKTAKEILKKAIDLLEKDPFVESRNMKTLRPNPVAQRELRVLGKYRVLFNVEESEENVTINLVAEKRTNKLIVQGEEFTKHHESNPTEQGEGTA